jgi:hypothetical protein
MMSLGTTLAAILMGIRVVRNENIVSTCRAVCIWACFVENYYFTKDF